MSATYTEFEWQSEAPGNGESGAGLAQTFVRIISGLERVERICDLGCGNGYLAGLLADAGYDVTGVDASPSGIEIARSTYSAPKFIFSQLDRAVEHAGAEQFDLVISSDVIEHLYRPAVLLEAASALLNPAGPNSDWRALSRVSQESRLELIWKNGCAFWRSRRWGTH